MTIALAALLGTGALPAAGQRNGTTAPNLPYDGQLNWARIRYGSDTPDLSGYGGFRRYDPMWNHDVPRGETNLLRILQELTSIWTDPEHRSILRADDPELFKHPIAYIVEVGFWHPTDSEVLALRNWLLKGGFLIVDDFRGDHDVNFRAQMRRVLPNAELQVLDGTAGVFDSFFRIPNPYELAPPYEQELAPVYLGIYEGNDPKKRMMVIANYNQDISEYWEFSDYGYYPIDLSNDAYKFGVNYVMYGLTH